MNKGLKYLLIGALFGTLVIGCVNIAEAIKNRIDNLQYPHQVNCSIDMSFKKTCNIYMASEIGEIEAQKNVIETLTTAGHRDEVILHMNGYGGRIDSMVQILNAIKDSKAETTVSVEGPVYSAHAAISLAADNLEVGKYSYFMFHRSSAYKSTACAGQVGFDRGVSRRAKCEAFMKAHLLWTDEGVLKDTRKVLTNEEFNAIFNGGDVYIKAEEIKRRFDKVNLITKREKLELSRIDQK